MTSDEYPWLLSVVEVPGVFVTRHSKYSSLDSATDWQSYRFFRSTGELSP